MQFKLISKTFLISISIISIFSTQFRIILRFRLLLLLFPTGIMMVFALFALLLRERVQFVLISNIFIFRKKMNYYHQSRRNRMNPSLLFWILKLLELSLLSLLLLLLLLLLSFTLATMLAATLPAAITKLRKVKALNSKLSLKYKLLKKFYNFLIGLAGLQFSLSGGS